jgi:hypothetical protein
MNVSVGSLRQQTLALRKQNLSWVQIGAELGITSSRAQKITKLCNSRSDNYKARKYAHVISWMVADVWHTIAVKDIYHLWRPSVEDYDGMLAAHDAGLVFLTHRFSGTPGTAERKIELVARLTPVAVAAGFGHGAVMERGT